MNFRHQTIQEFVTSPGPFGDCSCKCLLTKECMVYQCVPNTSISQQFESICLTLLQQIPILVFWLVGHQSMELLTLYNSWLFCSPTRNIAPHISFLHDLPYHKTMKRCLRHVSVNKEAFLLLLQRSGFKHISVIAQNIFARFAFSLSGTEIKMVKEWCWLCQIENNPPFVGLQISILNMELSPTVFQ